LRRGVDSGADALNLHDLVDDRPVAEAFDENRIRLPALKRQRVGGFPTSVVLPRRCAPRRRSAC
jgi:hypothetical protein